MRRWIITLAAALPLFAASACGGAGEAEPTTVFPAGTVRVLNSTEDWRTNPVPGHRDMKDLGLVGANSVLRVHQTSAVTEVNATSGETWGLDGPVRAADGQELFWASLRASPMPWTSEETPETQFTLVAGAVSMKLGIPEPDASDDSVLFTDAVVVSVPKGGPVSLRMTDGGVTQTLDLRAGKRGPDARGVYPLPSQSTGVKEFNAPGVTPDPFSEGRPSPSYLTLDTSGYSLIPWAPGKERGWAGKGRAWLRLNGVSVSGNMSAVIGYRLYSQQFFTVTAVDGKRYRPAKASLSVETIPGGTYGVYVDVPESFRAGTLTVDPVAGLREPDGDTIMWITKPKGASFPIKLAG